MPDTAIIPNDDTLLTMSQLRAGLQNRARSCIYDDIANDRLPKPIKLGGRLYFRGSSVHAKLSEQEVA